VLIPVHHNLGTNCCVNVISHACWQKLHLPVFIHWKILLMLTAAVSPCWPTDHRIQDTHNTVPFVAWETMVAQWLRRYATNQKVAGSIPAGVIRFFIDIEYFRSHCGPGVDSASTRNEYQEHALWGKGGRCIRLTTYHHAVPLSWNLGTLTSWNPLGLFRPVTGLLYLLYLLLHNMGTVHVIIYCFTSVEKSERVKDSHPVTCHEGTWMG